MPSTAAAGPGERGDGVTGALRLRAGRIALGVGVLVFLGKLSAYFLTGSTAVLSDALESVINVVAGGLLLFSLIVAARPADRDHPYGHGKVEFFSAGIEGSLILLAALSILWHAGWQIWRGPEVRNLDAGLLLLVPFSVANAVLGAYLVRVGRRTRSVALVADGKHVLTDVWTSAAVIVGLLGVRFTGWVILDPLVAIAAAANILREGARLLRDAVRGLMDEAEPESLAELATVLESAREPDWIDIHGLRAWRSGAFLHADFHMTVPRYLDVDQVHDIHESIQRSLRDSTDMAGDFVIHFDPCRPFHCCGCERTECPVRAAPFENREQISVESATRNEDRFDTEFALA